MGAPSRSISVRTTFDERAPRVHRLDRPLAESQLATARAAEKTVALLEDEREPLLVVRAARSADCEDARGERARAEAGHDVPFDLVEDRPLDVHARDRAPRGDPDRAVPGGGERREAVGDDDAEGDTATSDLFAEARHERSGVVSVGRRVHGGGRLGLGDPFARQA